MIRARIIGAWCLLVISIIGWPISAITVARAEPQFILGLSWLAIILTAIDILATHDVRKEQDGGDDGRS